MSPRLKQLAEGPEPSLVESESIAPEAMPNNSGRPRYSTVADIDSDERSAKKQPIGRRKGEAADAGGIAKQAKAELESITGLDADRVSAVMHTPEGWQVTVDLVELRRIPAATDVIAAYEAILGPTGVLLSYHRTRRYLRDQMFEEP